MVYTNGGHNPPLTIRTGESIEFIKMPQGMVLGIDEDTPYQSASLVLQPGDVLFMYTDGVTEAMNPQYELFSDKRLQAVLGSLKKSSLEEMSQGLMQQVLAFAEGAQQSDDITMLLLKYQGSQ